MSTTKSSSGEAVPTTAKDLLARTAAMMRGKNSGSDAWLAAILGALIDIEKASGGAAVVTRDELARRALDGGLRCGLEVTLDQLLGEDKWRERLGIPPQTPEERRADLLELAKMGNFPSVEAMFEGEESSLQEWRTVTAECARRAAEGKSS